MNKFIKWTLWALGVLSCILSGGFSSIVIYAAFKTPQPIIGMTILISFFTTSVICMNFLVRMLFSQKPKEVTK